MSLDVKRIEKNNRRLRKLLKKSSHLMDAGGVHRMRTRTREFEAVLRSLKLDAKSNERHLLRRLRSVRRKAGKVRDMDVLTAHIAALGLSTAKRGKTENVAAAAGGSGTNRIAGVDPCLIPLLEYLGERRYRYARKLRKAVAEHGSEIRTRLKKTASRLEKSVRDRKTPEQVTAEARAKVAEAVLHISEQLAVPLSLNQKNLHPYRKTVKQLRYILQTIQDHPDRELIEALGKCKDSIGEWHDWDELIKIATQNVKLETNCEAVKKLTAIRDEKYDSALAVTNKMRATHPQFYVATKSILQRSNAKGNPARRR